MTTNRSLSVSLGMDADQFLRAIRRARFSLRVLTVKRAVYRARTWLRQAAHTKENTND